MDNKFVYRKDINLLDRVNDKALKSNVKGTFAIVLAIIIVFLILVAIFVPKMIVSSKESELEGLQNQLAANQVYEDQYNSLTSGINVSRDKLDELAKFNNGGVTKVLEWLESVTPTTGVEIDTLGISSDSVITLTGRAADEKTIADFYDNVRKNENVVVTMVSGAESQDYDGSEVMGFSMTITYQFVAE